MRELAGKEESSMSTKRFGKFESPICGVVADVAPGGEQIVNPESQFPFASREAVAKFALAMRAT